MNASAYELLSLAMRYVFAGLMALIVLRAWRISAVDSGRAKKLRRLSPETGIIGELLVTDGGERARPGMRYPVTLEGTIGSGRRADIRIRHSAVRARHAYYMMTDEGLFVRGHASARIRGGKGAPLREMLLHDGEILRIGSVSLLLVLSDADEAPEEISRKVLRRRKVQERDEWNEPEAMDDSIFETADADDLFFSNPASCLSPEEYDFDDEDTYDDF